MAGKSIKPRAEVSARCAEDRRAARAVGVTVSLALPAALCWVTVATLAVAGVISAAVAVAIVVGGYLALTAVLCGVTAVRGRSSR